MKRKSSCVSGENPYENESIRLKTTFRINTNYYRWLVAHDGQYRNHAKALKHLNRVSFW